MHTGFWWVHLWETDHFENSGIDGRIILRWIFRKWDGGGAMDWMDLVQDWERWRALVKAALNLRVP